MKAAAVDDRHVPRNGCEKVFSKSAGLRIERIAKTVLTAAGAIATTSTGLGIVLLVAFSYAEPSGFPRFEPLALIQLLAPISVSGLMVIVVIVCLFGIAPFLYGSLGVHDVDTGGTAKRSAASPPSDDGSAIDPSDNICINHVCYGQSAVGKTGLYRARKKVAIPWGRLRSLLFFMALALMLMLWTFFQAHGSNIFHHFARSEVHVSSAVDALILGLIPVVASIATADLKALRSNFRARASIEFVRAASGLFWMAPFFFALLASNSAGKQELDFWVDALFFAAVAAVGNALATQPGPVPRSVGLALTITIAIAIAPRAILGAPFRPLGMVDAPRTITIEAGKAHEIRRLFQNCDRIAPAPLPESPDRYSVVISNEIGRDAVLFCSSMHQGRAWLSIPSDAILSREAAPLPK